MSTQLITPSRSAPSAPGPGHRRIGVAATAAVVVLIAVGGYLAAATIGPDATPRTGTEVNPSAQALRELHQSIAGQYAGRSAAGAVGSPSALARRELHESIAGQYRSQPAPGATVAPNPQVRRELRQSIAGQYGPAR